MASTTKGLSKTTSIATTATALDPIDLMGAQIERSQGFWVCNLDAANLVFLAIDGVTAALNGDDTICLLPRVWTWVARPDYNKSTTPTTKTGVGWNLIATTAACQVQVVSDNSSWHPYR